jgi:hypothetical protein
MILDDYRIAIRERSYLDVLDLSLRVIRSHAAPLAVAFLVGIGPIAILDVLLFHYLKLDPKPNDIEDSVPAWYLFQVFFLIVWQTPLATAPATLYLGQALFAERPSPRHIASTFLSSLPQLIYYQVFVRALLMLPIFTWFVLFALRPYLNEVLLLERNPFSAGRSRQVTTRRRVSSLHGGMEGEFVTRWLCNAGIGLALFLSIVGSLECLAGILTGDLADESIVYTLYFPLALWIVMAFFTVVRFLAYLDIRIRREGWEVELLMRAEQARWTRKYA